MLPLLVLKPMRRYWNRAFYGPSIAHDTILEALVL